MDGYHTGELTLARRTVAWLKAGMLCLADRGFFSFEFWCQACATGADLLWRVQGNAVLPCRKALSDGFYLSRIYPSPGDRRNDRRGVWVRVVEYRLRGSRNPDQVYRLSTTLHWTRIRPQPASWRLCITRGGRSRRLSMSSRLTCGTSDRSAKQNTRTGLPGVLRLDVGPFCRSQPDA